LKGAVILVLRRHPPRRRGIQYAAASRLITAASGILDRPPEPVIGLAEGETRWRTMTAERVATEPAPRAPAKANGRGRPGH